MTLSVLERSVESLRLEEDIRTLSGKGAGVGIPGPRLPRAALTRPGAPHGTRAHLLERALLFQRHELVAPVLLGGAGLAQAHALRPTVALERPQVARAQAFLQPAQRRH